MLRAQNIKVRVRRIVMYGCGPRFMIDAEGDGAGRAAAEEIVGDGDGDGAGTRVVPD